MRISIEMNSKNSQINIYSDYNFLGTMESNDFFNLLDQYQTEAYEDGEMKFSVNEHKLKQYFN